MTELKVELNRTPLENNTERRGELNISDLLYKVQEASLRGYDYVEIDVIERALIALAVLNGATNVPSLSAAINFLQSAGEEIDESDDEIGPVVRISPPLVIETIATLQESSAVLSRVPGQQKLSRRALQASVNIETTVESTVISLAPTGKDQLDQTFIRQ